MAWSRCADASIGLDDVICNSGMPGSWMGTRPKPIHLPAGRRAQPQHHSANGRAAHYYVCHPFRLQCKIFLHACVRVGTFLPENRHFWTGTDHAW